MTYLARLYGEGYLENEKAADLPIPNDVLGECSQSLLRVYPDMLANDRSRPNRVCPDQGYRRLLCHRAEPLLGIVNRLLDDANNTTATTVMSRSSEVS